MKIRKVILSSLILWSSISSLNAIFDYDEVKIHATNSPSVRITLKKEGVKKDKIQFEGIPVGSGVQWTGRNFEIRTGSYLFEVDEDDVKVQLRLTNRIRIIKALGLKRLRLHTELPVDLGYEIEGTIIELNNNGKIKPMALSIGNKKISTSEKKRENLKDNKLAPSQKFKSKRENTREAESSTDSRGSRQVPITKSEQKKLADDLYKVESKDCVSLKERFESLQALARAGNQWAQKYVTCAIYMGTFKQGKRSKEERFNSLNILAQEGDKWAQEKLSRAIYDGALGQESRTEEERFASLEALAKDGNKWAQWRVMQAIYFGDLGQRNRRKKERFQELQSVAKEGNKSAQWWVLHALCNGGLGQRKCSEKERLDALHILAKCENPIANKFLAKALYEGLGRTKLPGKKSLSFLLNQARRGNHWIWKWVAEFIYEDIVYENENYKSPHYIDPYNLFDPSWGGNAGRNKGIQKRVINFVPDGSISEEERFNWLQDLARGGNRWAEWWMLQAISFGELGQGARSEEERLQELQTLAKEGNDAARWWVSALYDKPPFTLRENICKNLTEYDDKWTGNWAEELLAYESLSSYAVTPEPGNGWQLLKIPESEWELAIKEM